MKNKLFWIIAAFAAASCQTPVEIPSEEPAAPAKEVEGSIIPGCAVIEFDESMIPLIESDLEGGGVTTKSDALNAVADALGIVKMERVFPYAGEFEPRTREAGLHRFYTVEFDESIPVTKAVEDIDALPGVVSVNPQRRIRLRGFNDPYFSSQWHYVNTRSSGADINVQAVWDNYTVGRSDVIVCVVDEPVDPTHPDLQANLWKDGSGHTGYNFARSSYDLSIRPENGDGDFGHGTHVAGTVAAVSNNGKGVAGIAGGDAARGIAGARLMSCAIFSGTKYASDAATARAIKWGADNGAVISQNSWGYYADEDGDYYVSPSELAEFKNITIDATTKGAIDYFIEKAGCDAQGNQTGPMKGGLVIFAAGNEDIDYDPICTYEPVISVGAFGATGKKASYSNYGSWVDLAAPGGDGSYGIYSTLPTKIESGGYGGTEWQGTSMACPHASGVAALIISYFGGPGFTAEQCREFLLEGAKSFSSSKPIGRKLDALGSINYGIAHMGNNQNPVPPTITLPTTEVTVKAHETVSIPIVVSDENGDRVTVTCNTGSAAATFTEESGGYTLTIVGRKAKDGTYEAAIKAVDATGLETVETIRYTILPNHAPVVKRSVDNLVFTTLSTTNAIDLKGVFEDPDGETLDIEIAVSDESVASGVTTQFETISVTSHQYGFCDITVKATDALGLSAEVTASVLVRNPQSHMVASYPNPVSQVLFVRIDSENADTEIRLVSSSGSTVYYDVVKGASAFNAIPVNVIGIAPGIYTLMVTYEGNTVTRKIIKR